MAFLDSLTHGLLGLGTRHAEDYSPSDNATDETIEQNGAIKMTTPNNAGNDFDAQIEQAVGDLQIKTILEQMEDENVKAVKNLDELASHYERERDKMAKLASDTRIGIMAIKAHQGVIDEAKKREPKAMGETK